MTADELRVASRMSWVTTVIGTVAPVLVVATIEQGGDLLPLKIFNAASFAASAYVLLALRKLLIVQFQERSLENWIWATIFLGGVGLAIGLIEVPAFYGDADDISIVGLMIILLPVALVNVLFGRKILSLEANLYDMNRILGTLLLVVGILMLTLVLVPIAALVNAAWFGALATMFGRATAAAKQSDPHDGLS